MQAHRLCIRISLVALVIVTGLLGISTAAQSQTNSSATGTADVQKPPAVLANTAPTTQPAPGAPGKKMQTNPLTAFATVKSNVTVEAGLLTPQSAKDLFGGWVADHFAVVQVTIGNQSRDQQFVLHDIFFDYSNWGLSGIYAIPDHAKKERSIQDHQSSTSPGQISSIGAFEVHDALKSNSVFSKRNFVVNGLILVGASAGGFALLGPKGFTEGVTGYNSNFIPALQQFWPDRRIDQQSNVLKYGFQDKLVIAKEDPGKTYAFFPIDRFLTNGLVKLYRKDPALFLNLAELYIDPSAIHPRLKTSETKLKDKVDDLILASIDEDGDLADLACAKDKASSERKSSCHGALEFNAMVLSDLFSPCYYGKFDHTNNLDGEQECTLLQLSSADEAVLESKRGELLSLNKSGTADESVQDRQTYQRIKKGLKLRDIRAIKDTIASASLNSVRVVVSGIMTVDIEQIPATLTKVEFDDSNKGEVLWNGTTLKHTGVISGKYLTNGKPMINAIKTPSGNSAKLSDYIDPNSMVTVGDQSTDSELHFTVQFGSMPIPSGSTLTFQVMKSSSKSVNDNSAEANIQETTTSMSFDYKVDYTSTTPEIETVNFVEIDTALWAKAGATFNGTITGKNLSGGSVKISSVMKAGEKTPTTDTYVATDSIQQVKVGSSDTTLKFTFKPKAPIPAGATITFTVTTKDASQKDQVSKGGTFITPK